MFISKKRTQGTMILNHLNLVCVYPWQTATKACTIFISSGWYFLPTEMVLHRSEAIQWTDPNLGFFKDALYFLFQRSTSVPQLKIATKWTDKHCSGCTANGCFPLELNWTNHSHEHSLNTRWAQGAVLDAADEILLTMSEKAKAPLGCWCSLDFNAYISLSFNNL